MKIATLIAKLEAHLESLPAEERAKATIFVNTGYPYYGVKNTSKVNFRKDGSASITLGSWTGRMTGGWSG